MRPLEASDNGFLKGIYAEGCGEKKGLCGYIKADVGVDIRAS